MVNGLANLQFQCLYAHKNLWGDCIQNNEAFDIVYLNAIYIEKSLLVDKLLRVLSALVQDITFD